MIILIDVNNLIFLDFVDGRPLTGHRSRVNADIIQFLICLCLYTFKSRYT